VSPQPESEAPKPTPASKNAVGMLLKVLRWAPGVFETRHQPTRETPLIFRDDRCPMSAAYSRAGGNERFEVSGTAWRVS